MVEESNKITAKQLNIIKLELEKSSVKFNFDLDIVIYLVTDVIKMRRGDLN
jgi:hypothetical protein